MITIVRSKEKELVVSIFRCCQQKKSRNEGVSYETTPISQFAYPENFQIFYGKILPLIPRYLFILVSIRFGWIEGYMLSSSVVELCEIFGRIFAEGQINEEEGWGTKENLILGKLKVCRLIAWRFINFVNSHKNEFNSTDGAGWYTLN